MLRCCVCPACKRSEAAADRGENLPSSAVGAEVASVGEEISSRQAELKDYNIGRRRRENQAE